MDSSQSGLSRIQSEFLQGWFELTSEYFLTGGAALVVALDIPRTTKDLDLVAATAQFFTAWSEKLACRHFPGSPQA